MDDRGIGMIDELLSKRWILVSGKGGTGKTVLASSLAIQMAKEGEKTLVTSIDPAHSLSDALKMDIGSEIKDVQDVDNLHALEFTPQEMYELDEEKLKAAIGKYEEEFGEMGGMLSLSPEELLGTVTDFSNLPLEYAEGISFIKLFRSLQDSEFDKIIFDTAPTGHTLKLLELPDTLDSLLGKMIKFRLKITSFWNRFKAFFGGGAENPQEEILKSLEKLKGTVKEFQSVIRNEKQTEFISVTIPTKMSILESLRLVGTLEGYEIPHHFLVVNQLRISGEDSSCNFCQNLSKLHRKNLKEIQEKFDNLTLRCVPYFSEEVRGLENLEEFYRFANETSPEKVKRWFQRGEPVK